MLLQLSLIAIDRFGTSTLQVLKFYMKHDRPQFEKFLLNRLKLSG